MARRILIILFCCSLFYGCSTKHYRKSADREVASIIKQKTPAVPNMDTNFTIEVSDTVSLTNLPVYDKAEEAFGAESEMERGSRILTLDQALDIAINHSRSYQTRKEDVYLSALQLTLQRHRYTPIFSGSIRAVDRRTPVEVKKGIDTVIEEHHAVSASSIISMDALLRTGTQIATDFSTDFLRFLTGGGGTATSSALVARLTHPLLRGGGYKIAIETLTQAERDVLYDLRSFSRYRREFIVSTASAYYDVLRNRDAVRNSWRGLQNFKLNVAREKAFAEEGQRSQASLDQLKQAELQTESRWISAIRTYRQSLDLFKNDIGLHTDDRVVLHDAELEELKVAHPHLAIDDAVRIALVSRLDLDTERDQLDDAARHVKVAANSLLPQLDIIADAEVGGSATGSRFPSPDWEKYRWNAGLKADLPFDRKAQRNSYRASLIAFERAKRALDLKIDQIKLEIAEDWRQLDQAKRNYEISELGVQIAERRVEEQQLRQELGRGTARDLVDAQNDLIDSKNQRTSALVGHTIARLRFWRDMGILFVKENGQWNEILSNDTNDNDE